MENMKNGWEADFGGEDKSVYKMLNTFVAKFFEEIPVGTNFEGPAAVMEFISALNSVLEDTPLGVLD
jgi:hypothetical protein